MADEQQRVLIVEARFYEDVADALAKGAIEVLEATGYASDRINVPGVFEVPGAAKMALAGSTYSGIITLGCVIRGETDHYDHICREVSRSLMDFTSDGLIPHGFGILTCENREQAWVRADTAQRNIGGRAAQACLRMIDVKNATANG